MTCPDFDLFKKLILRYDQAVEIEKDSEKKTRINVWNTTPDTLAKLLQEGIDSFPDADASIHIKDKLKLSLQRISDATGKAKAEKFLQDLIFDGDQARDSNLQSAIALHELFESVKGESDKAATNGIEIDTISADLVLPSVPKSRLAASIGRKIAYQQGYRFRAQKDDQSTPEQVERLYYTIGLIALNELKDKGYVTIQESAGIKDFYTEAELNKSGFRKSNTFKAEKMPTVSINTDKLGIKKGSLEAEYFLNRTESDIAGTQLGTITEVLRIARNITQPSNLHLPAVNGEPVGDLSQWDNQKITPSDTEANVRQRLFDNPLKVSQPVHELLTVLNHKVRESGMSATQLIKSEFKGHKKVLKSLFGLMSMEDTSVDKKESVVGRNLSKTVPLNDLIENYHELVNKDGSPADLRFAMHNGRNDRLYYLATVLNAHSSKSARYSLTSGSYSIEYGSDDFDYFVYKIFDALGDKDITYDQIVGTERSKLDSALEDLRAYKNSNTASVKLADLSNLTLQFPNTDYALLLTTLQAVQDIRNAKDGLVETEFMVSADATASGGTLTMMQALGTNPNVTTVLQRIGLLNGLDESTTPLNDFYGLLSEAIEDFVDGTRVPGLKSQDKGKEKTGSRYLLDQAITHMFNDSRKLRDLSKSPTMTFVYGQGRAGAMNSMSEDLATNIIENLDNQDTRKFLAILMNDQDLADSKPAELRSTKGLFSDIKSKLQEPDGLSAQLYDLMDAVIAKTTLDQYQQRSKEVFEFVQNLPKEIAPRVLPPNAVMDGVELNAANLKKYGVPLSSVIQQVSEDGTVLTRKESRAKTVMDVSLTHATDSALLYRALDKALGRDGAVVVHDDVRSTVQQVRETESQYLKEAIAVLSTYDSHQQVMRAVALYSPEIAKKPAFKKLMTKIDQNVEAKSQILSEMVNMKSSALIGDGTAHQEFAKKSRGKSARKKPKASSKKDPNTILTELQGESDIIDSFLNAANRASVAAGTENKFLTDSDTITLTGTSQGRETANGGDGVTRKPLDLNNPEDRQLQRELIEHEIVHSTTAAYIHKALNDDKFDHQARVDVHYLQKTVKELAHKRAQAVMTGEYDSTTEGSVRLDYILTSGDLETQVNELVAVLSTEPENAKFIYNLLAGNKASNSLKQRIEKFVARVKDWLLDISAEDFAKEVDLDLLNSALQRTLANGMSFRQEQAAVHADTLKRIDAEYGAGKKDFLDQEHVNRIVRSMITSKMETGGKRLLGNTHNLLARRFPVYVTVVDKLQGIYDSSEALQELVHTITAGNVDKGKKADILAKFAEVARQRNELINSASQDLHRALKGSSEQEKAVVEQLIDDTPLHDYFANSSDGSLDTAEKIDARVKELAEKLSDTTKTEVEELVAFNVKGSEDTPSLYNLEAKYPRADTEASNSIRLYMALRSIQEVGTKDFENFLANTDLVNTVKDQVMANHLSALSHDGNHQIRDSGVADYFQEHVELRAIRKEDMHSYEYGDNSGWEIVSKPTATALGIVARKTIDSTDMLGAFTDIKLQSADVHVPVGLGKFSNVSKAPDGQYKIMLTKKQRSDLNRSKDFVQNLSHSTAHSIAIQDSQVIRDELLKFESRMEISSENKDDLVNLIADKGVDHPWFLKLDSIGYSDLPKEVKAKYKPVQGALSDVNRFNDQIDLVRKDISHWLIGGHAKSLFQNPKMKWATRIVKDLIAASKINMVILNPAKIFRDNISNTSYLGMRGVDPVFIGKQYHDIATEFAKYQDLQEQLVHLKLKQVANPDDKALAKKISSLEKSRNETSIGDIADKGFLNSLGSSLIVRDADTLSGVQADYHTALEYLLKKDGKRNYVGHFLSRLQNIGFRGEDFFAYLSSKMDDEGLSKGVKAELDKVHERLSEIRSDNDIVNYVTQYTSSPGSEMVRVGANVADLTDVVAKETLYRHLIEHENYTPEQARLDVLESFPDYKENLPLRVKQLSDMGILMFPSFWMRIQRAIYRLAKDKPVNLATEMLIEQVVLDSDVDTVLDANLWEKATGYHGIIHSPHEAPGTGSISPFL